jgi:hypothetical protein
MPIELFECIVCQQSLNIKVQGGIRMAKKKAKKKVAKKKVAKKKTAKKKK